MNKNHTIPELLAPAGSVNALKAAVENGADAVYMGTGEFNARINAENFTIKTLLNAIDFAHSRDVSAYITVNTLIKDHEMDRVVKYLELLCNHGADAVIIQDIGVLGIIKKQFRELPIHASTQMSIHNSTGIELLGSLGIKRAVLARELTLGEINSIRSGTDIELEVFIHGALCISYSGRCLMSSYIGGRSGNRGRCAQPCRKKYQVFTSKAIEDMGYLLSPRDLNLSSRLGHLIAAGVDSFKIEGRMKKPEYVAVVTKTYRDILDRLRDDPNAGITLEEQQRLEIIFNRGFVEGFLNGNPGRSLMSIRLPGNHGTFLGRVKRYDPDLCRVFVELEVPVHLGDGIAIGNTGTLIRSLYADGQMVTKAPGKSQISFPYENPVAAGIPVYKTLDSKLIESSRKSYQSVFRKISISIKVQAIKQHPLLICMSDSTGNTAEVSSETGISAAIQQPLDIHSLKRQVCKLGDTVFRADNVDIKMDDDIFIPLGVINSLRRRAVKKLTQLRISKYYRKCNSSGLIRIPDIKNDKVQRPILSVRVAGVDSILAAILGGADRIYVTLDSVIDNKSLVDTAISKAHRAGTKVFISLPDIIKDHEKNTILNALGNINRIDGILVSCTDQLYLLNKKYDIPLVVDYPANAYNRETLGFLTHLGANCITISPELTFFEIAEISAFHKIECIIQGSIQLMVSDHCLCNGINEFGIRDEKGFEFPVRFDHASRTHIFNSRELCMIDHIPDLLKIGIFSMRIEGILYSTEQIRTITTLYRKAIDSYLDRRDRFNRKEYLLAIKKASSQDLTTGHYFRPVE
jgi:putative protease